jgi:hypothetical protein
LITGNLKSRSKIKPWKVKNGRKSAQGMSAQKEYRYGLNTVPWKIVAGKFNLCAHTFGTFPPNVFTFRLLEF